MAKRIGANKRAQLQAQGRSEKRSRKRSGRGVIRLVLLLGILAGAGYAGVQGVRACLRRLDGLEVLGVRRVVITGAERVDSAAVLDSARIEPGTPLHRIGGREIRRRIEKFAWIKKVRIGRRLPGSVVLHITEKKPVAYVNAGGIYVMDEEGRLHRMEAGYFDDLPIVRGVRDSLVENGGRHIKKSDFDMLKEFRREVKNTAPGISKRITQIDFSEETVDIKLESYRTVITLARARVPQGMRRLRRLVENMGGELDDSPERIRLQFESLAYVH